MITAVLRTIFNPAPHPIAEKVERASQRLIRESARLDKQKDAFANMIRGMRGEAKRRRTRKQ